jgi:hypothetical protein
MFRNVRWSCYASVPGGQAEFREGQEEAIRHIVEGHNRLLVVQWSGESMAATSGQRRRVGAAEKTGL